MPRKTEYIAYPPALPNQYEVRFQKSPHPNPVPRSPYRSAYQSENISSGDFLSLLVDGDDKLMDLSHEARLDWILYETQKRLEMELSTDKAVDNDIKARANLAIQKITELRNEIAGYYKDDSDKDVQFEFFD